MSSKVVRKKTSDTDACGAPPAAAWAAAGVVGVPQARAFVEHMSNDGAHDRAPDIPGYHEADQGPKEFAFPSHSR
jgi:hypothetical protein